MKFFKHKAGLKRVGFIILINLITKINRPSLNLPLQSTGGGERGGGKANNKFMQITIINDCCDENAKLRQISRAGSLIKNSSANCFGVKSEMEAAGFLADAIDAFEGREGVILANVAPRGGKGKRWENGTPFGYFWHKKTLIVSSADGLVLSLAKKKPEFLKSFI